MEEHHENLLEVCYHVVTDGRAVIVNSVPDTRKRYWNEMGNGNTWKERVGGREGEKREE